MLEGEPGVALAAPKTPADVDEIGRLLADASGARACAVAWESSVSRGLSFAPADCGDWRALAQSVLGALAQRVELSRDPDSSCRTSLATSELAAILGGRAVSAAAVARCDGTTRVRAVILAPIGRHPRELESLAELGCRCATALLANEEHEAAHAFWLRRGAETAEQLSQVSAELDEYRSRVRAIADLDQRTRALKVRDRFAEFAKMVASRIGCDQWMTQGGEAIAADPQVDAGVIALLSRAPISEDERCRLAALLSDFTPLLRSWRMELELENQRGLVQRMAYRMFSAVDEERARIARDLHDDHAQLLTATRLALSGGGDEARAMVERIEGELRRRIRELKPASLGRISLPHALSIEAERLAQAGIEMTTTGMSEAATISRAAQNLCWLFAREAISNAIRHSHATHVAVAIRRSPCRVTISVTDDGIGIKHSSDGNGTGLAGIRERLSLMGGEVKLRSRPGKTVLRAEIPDPL